MKVSYWGQQESFQWWRRDGIRQLPEYIVQYVVWPYSNGSQKVGLWTSLQKDNPMPYNCMYNCLAGEDWFARFIKRHKEISIRTPEATSLAHAASFNKKQTLLPSSRIWQMLNLVTTSHFWGPVARTLPHSTATWGSVASSLPLLVKKTDFGQQVFHLSISLPVCARSTTATGVTV